MGQRIKQNISKENIEIIIEADNTYFISFAFGLVVWFFVGLFLLYFSTAIRMDCLFTLITLLFWITVFTLTFIITYWHLCGTEIIKIDNKNLSLTKKIKAISFTRSFDVTKISSLRVTTFREKLFMGSFEFSLNDLSIYPGTIGFDLEDKTYHFALQIDHNKAVELAQTIKDFIDNESRNNHLQR
ncbi:MAG: hypothetical protein AB1782_14305 [Cyanobacteriota bacterium]